MDFAGVLGRVETFLTERHWRFALAGGVALAVYGNPRLTLDLDVVTEGEAQEALDPTRTLQDMADVSYLLKLAGTNRDEARDFFVKAGLLEKWEELARGL